MDELLNYASTLSKLTVTRQACISLNFERCSGRRPCSRSVMNGSLCTRKSHFTHNPIHPAVKENREWMVRTVDCMLEMC
jgi:hypothetical protein